MEIVGIIALLYLLAGVLCLAWFWKVDGHLWNPRYDATVNIMTFATAILMWWWVVAIELLLYLPSRKGWIQKLTGLEEWILLGAMLTAFNVGSYVFFGFIPSGVLAGVTSLYTVVVIGVAVRRREHEFKRSCC